MKSELSGIPFSDSEKARLRFMSLSQQVANKRSAGYQLVKKQFFHLLHTWTGRPGVIHDRSYGNKNNKRYYNRQRSPSRVLLLLFSSRLKPF